MSLYAFTDRVVLRLAPKARDFLSAYTTNLPEAPRSAFCDRRGRVVAVVDQSLTDSDQAWLVVAASVERRLREHLRPYLDVTGTELESTPLRVYFDPDSTCRPADGERLIPQATGSLLLSGRARPAGMSEEEFRSHRLEHRIALQGVDFDAPMLLELDDPSLVSFTKGCYLGQEIIARVRYRSKPPKCLRVVEAQENSPEAAELTSRVAFTPGRVRGFRMDPTAETAPSAAQRLEEAVRKAFLPLHLEVVDESARHAGHLDPSEEPTHWRVTVVSAAFESKSPLERHRAVYAVVASAAKSLHALTLRAMTPSEWEKRTVS